METFKLNEKDFATLDNNDIYVYPTITCRFPDVFTRKHISQGYDLCYKKGV